jgi:tubulin beta
MVPFPSLNFVVPVFAPLTSHSTWDPQKNTIEQLPRQIFDAKNTMAECDPRKGCYLAVAAMFQGHMSTVDVNRQMIQIQMDDIRYGHWIFKDMKSSIFGSPPRTLDAATTLVANTTSIKDVFSRVLREFNFKQENKRYITMYENIGIKDYDFSVAKSKLNNLVSKYELHDCQRRCRV